MIIVLRSATALVAINRSLALAKHLDRNLLILLTSKGTPEKVDKGLPNRKDKKKDKRFDEEVECTSEYIGPEERTKMKNDIILAKRAMRASNAAKQKAMSDNERILKSLGKFGKTTPEECDK